MRLMQGVMDPADYNEELLDNLWQEASALNKDIEGVTATGLAKVCGRLIYRACMQS